MVILELKNKVMEVERQREIETGRETDREKGTRRGGSELLVWEMERLKVPLIEVRRQKGYLTRDEKVEFNFIIK